MASSPSLDLISFYVGGRHVSMQLSRSFSGLTNLLFNKRYSKSAQNCNALVFWLSLVRGKAQGNNIDEAVSVCQTWYFSWI